MNTTSPGRAAPAIDLRDVHRSFPGRPDPVHAVRGISLQIQQGEIVALLGPNGAGKTTLLDMVLGFQAPSSGTVRVLGMEPATAAHAGDISALLQTGGLLADLSVRETVAMLRTVQAHPISVDAALAQAGASAFATRKVSKCSGGQQQRLRFALALLADPQILVLDEPTAGMDVGARREFWATMRDQAAHGRTIVFATHYLEEAQEFAQRIVLVSDGVVIADGPIAQIQASVSFKTIRFTAPAVDDAALAQLLAAASAAAGVPVTVGSATFAALPESAGVRCTVTTGQADALGRALFAAPDATEIEITPAGLDEAFVALTANAGTQTEGQY